MLAQAAEVQIIETDGYDLDSQPDAPRIAISGEEIKELGRMLAIVDGGTGDHCRCPGFPTILLRDATGRQITHWSLHHQTMLRSVGNSDAELRDGAALTDWLADRGLVRSREIQLLLARYAAEEELRRASWVEVAPPDLTAVTEAVSRREDGAEEHLVDLVYRRFADPVERIRVLAGWAGFPARYETSTGGTPWYEQAPQRMLLTEPTEAIFRALASAPLTASQLDGAAELFTALEWEADIPDSLKSALIAHVTATGTGPMKFRMRHGYGKDAGVTGR
ncbi:hypothetical protein SAMN04489716_3061 [Actinoplanes derwentensis]|uniref:Uncharacterized protein n=2 Tax=Actinoplanes derwentensis TaxID=113562 RepID=A0A1H1YZB9_9ACTN|nr:hypothetical protein SAMN04489716_3061 [Actinoplanes derwentensis]